MSTDASQTADADHDPAVGHHGHPAAPEDVAGSHGPGHGAGHEGGQGGGHGDHVEMFRRRFWWSLLLTLPVVATSHMVMDWFGYDFDFPGWGQSGPGWGRSSTPGAAGLS